MAEKMKHKKLFKIQNIILLSLLVFIFSIGVYAEVEKGGSTNGFYKTNETGEFFVFDINNLFLPLDNKGVIADVIPGQGSIAGGKLGGDNGTVFLFSSGFYLSGYTDKNNDGTLAENEMWGNGVLSASRIEDYQPGPYGVSQGDPKNKVYTVRAQDKAFGPSWQDWKDAVSIGADFYDGDGDGVYNPVDKNGDGAWNVNEDRPDLIGDVTAWTVYNDGVPTALRRYTVEPQGTEIHQTVFGFQTKTGAVSNMMFVRYRLINTGAVADTFYNCYFSAAADPDLGDHLDDLVGCDIDLSAGYVYNGSADADFGPNPPCFLMDFFQGPVVYIPGETFVDANGNGLYDEGETALDTAFNVNGRQLGIIEYPGATNKPLTAMTQYMQSHPSHGDPDTHFELRNYLLGGRGKNGDSLYVSNWEFGNGDELSDTAQIDTRYMYSGDPVLGTGWLNTNPIDQRQMSNTGPFKLIVGEPQDIIVAYVVGRGDSGPNSVNVAKEYSAVAQLIFDNNFPSPPPPPPIPYTVKMNEDYIEIDFETADNLNYNAVDTVFQIDRKTQGFFINAYRTSSTENSINGIQNKKQIAAFSVDNFINDVYALSSNGGVDLVMTKNDDLITGEDFLDPAKGRVRVRITSNPFEPGSPLTKGEEFYFQLGSFTLNHIPLVGYQPADTNFVYGDVGDYYDPTGGAYKEWPRGTFKVVFGSDFYSPSVSDAAAENATGATDGEVKYIVVDKTQLTGDNYSVEFFQDDTSTLYSNFWKLTNQTTNTVLIDSSKNFNFSDKDISGTVVDGFVMRVMPIDPGLKSQSELTAGYQSVNPTWFEPFSRTGLGGVYYVGTDIAAGTPYVGNPLTNMDSQRSTKISVDKLRRVELRFGETSKAYRYVNGIVGTPFTRGKTFAYAEAVEAGDTTGSNFKRLGEGFVDVPFSAWVVDERYGEEYQLATGFVERTALFEGIPDGIWNPTNAIEKTLETILIFNSPYDANGANVIYTGVAGDWADLISGYTLPAASGATAEEIEIAASPYFNTMYVVNLPVSDIRPEGTFTAGDILPIELSEYPYTEKDMFEFSTSEGGSLSQTAKKELFEKVNVFPNPLFAHNPATSYDPNRAPDDAFVTFSNLPDEVTIKIYSLSGILLKTLRTEDKDSPGSTFLRWDLKNEAELRVASGMYIAMVESPGFGQKILKLAIIMPQKQLQRF